MSRIKISICIPTYDRANRVIELLELLLENQDLPIEVIVCDDAKTNQLKDCILENKYDERLKYYYHESPLGQYGNLFDSFAKANGEYVFSLMDRDTMNCENILYLIELLEENEGDVIIGSYRNYNDRPEVSVYKQGNYKLISHCFESHHLSGLIFKRTKLIPVLNQNEEKYLNTDIVGFFPLDFIIFDVLDQGGDFVKIEREIYKMASEAYLAKTESSSISTLGGIKSLSIKGFCHQFGKDISYLHKVYDCAESITKVYEELITFYYYRSVFYNFRSIKKGVNLKYNGVQTEKITFSKSLNIGKSLEKILNDESESKLNKKFFRNLRKSIIKEYIKQSVIKTVK